MISIQEKVQLHGEGDDDWSWILSVLPGCIFIPDSSSHLACIPLRYTWNTAHLSVPSIRKKIAKIHSFGQRARWIINSVDHSFNQFSLRIRSTARDKGIRFASAN